MVAKILATRVAGKITLPKQSGKLAGFACANVTVVATSKDLLPHAPNEFSQPQVGAHRQGEDDQWTVHVFYQGAAQQRVLPVGGWTGQVRVHVYRRLAHRLPRTDGRPIWHYEDGQSCGREGDVRDAGVITASAGRLRRPT